MSQENHYDELQEKLSRLNQEVEALKNRGGGMLSSSDFLKLVILQDIEKAKKDFWNRKWKKWDRKFIIHPFNPKNLTPFSYDLSVGAEIYSCNHSTVEELTYDDNVYWMYPRETIVIKTEELIALPPYYSATVWPRFSKVTEAIFQSMVKIDPTWYGELGVAITNLSAAKYPVRRGETFATLILYELTSPTGMFLYRKENLPEPEKFSLDFSLDHDSINKQLQAECLNDICAITDGKMELKEAPEKDAFQKLLYLNESENWREVVIKCLASCSRKMDGLGLTTLELIRPTKPKGKMLSKPEVRDIACNETDLENAAIEHGPPFDLLPAIPDFIMEKIDRETIPRIRAEVEAAVFPKTITLTLTVLGFLSFIVAVAAFLIDKYRIASPLSGIDWSGTVALGLFVLGLLSMFALGILLFRRLPDSRAIKRLEREVEKLKQQAT
jgi:deoxycytidine triphosphate deaminase